MKDKDIKQIIINLIWSIIGGFLSYIVNFFLTSYIVNRIGIEAYGFVSLGNTLISYINIIAVGLNSFAARFIAVYYHKGEYEEASSVYSSILIANIILSIVILFVSIPMIVRLENLLVIPQNLIFDVKLLFIFVLLNYLINLFVGVVNTVAFINNKTGVTARIKSVTAIIYMILSIVLFGIVGVKIYYVGIANIAASIVCFILAIKCMLKIDDKIKFSLKKCSLGKVKEVVSAGVYNSINSLGGTLGSGLDLIITNKLLSNLAMGQISVGNQIGMIATMGTSIISGVFQPKQLEAYSKNNTNGLIKQLLVSMKVCGFVGGGFLMVFTCLGYFFLELWMPTQQIEMIYVITIIVLIGNAIVSITTPLYYVMTLTLKMKSVCFITVACGVMNVSSMLLFIRNNIGIGQFVIVGTTAVLDIVALGIFPHLSKKYLKLAGNPFWKLIFKYIVFMICSCCGAFSVSKILIINSWIGLICVAVICGLLFGGVYMLIIFNAEEKTRVKLFFMNKWMGL